MKYNAICFLKKKIIALTRWPWPTIDDHGYKKHSANHVTYARAKYIFQKIHVHVLKNRDVVYDSYIICSAPDPPLGTRCFIRNDLYLRQNYKVKYAIVSISNAVSGPSNASDVFVHLHSLKTFKNWRHYWTRGEVTYMYNNAYVIVANVDKHVAF